MSSPPLIVVAGALANKPGNGGEAWVRLSWLRGLTEIGADVRFVEVLDHATCHDHAGEPCAPELSIERRWFDAVTTSFGLARHAALLCDGQTLGAAANDPRRWGRDADLLVDVSGHLAGSPLFDDYRRTLFVDLDPGYTQIWHARSDAGDTLGRHTFAATVGLAVGTGDCDVPAGDIDWIHVPPFVTADEIVPAPPATGPERWSTVTTWRQPYGPIEWMGTVHSSKHHEFRRFAGLPRCTDARLELATTFHPDDERDRALLTASGWSLVDSRTAAGTPAAFRRYIAASAGEWSVAQGVYVGLRTGWLSDRTVRYLAAGRPAIVQSTGLPAWVPTGEGLVTFVTLDDAAAAIEAVRRHPARHRRAALRLVETHFSAKVVLPALLARCGVRTERAA